MGTCRTQIPFHQGNGNQETSDNQWDRREGQLSRPPYENSTDECIEGMEENLAIVMDDWLAIGLTEWMENPRCEIT